MLESTYPYLTDTRDQVLCAATPMLMAPRFGILPPLALDQHRYIATTDGIYLQTRSQAISLCLRITKTPPLPYGVLKPFVQFTGGTVPPYMGRSIYDKAVQSSPQEWAGVVLWDDGRKEYVLHEPQIESASQGHITYKTNDYNDSNILIDIHSHGNGKAYFSATDNLSDAGGIYVACVLGLCHAVESVEIKTRIVAHGHFFDVAWSPWTV